MINVILCVVGCVLLIMCVVTNYAGGVWTGGDFLPPLIANSIISYLYLCVCNCCPIELVAHMDTGCLNKMYSIRKSEVCVAYIYGRISSFFQMCDTLVKYNWHEW